MATGAEGGRTAIGAPAERVAIALAEDTTTMGAGATMIGGIGATEGTITRGWRATVVVGIGIGTTTDAGTGIGITAVGKIGVIAVGKTVDAEAITIGEATTAGAKKGKDITDPMKGTGL